ncbi:hypothetical protein [Marasmitruncus massiliensis]|uniref:hypothetical protein n=1 Tax=Marasmitruncus massiliensis TaxID=1944642 RepID=UPI001FA90FEC|nr:hypothetical protein [Marasmitruncus massiliensis]
MRNQKNHDRNPKQQNGHQEQTSDDIPEQAGTSFLFDESKSDAMRESAPAQVPARHQGQVQMICA